MKIKGFTLSEVSIGMILGSILVSLGLTYLTLLNHSTIFHTRRYENLHDFHLFHSILSNELKHYHPIISESSISFLTNGNNEVISRFHFYPDSIVYESKTPHLFPIKAQIKDESTNSTMVLKITFPELSDVPALIYKTHINKGFKLNKINSENKIK